MGYFLYKAMLQIKEVLLPSRGTLVGQNCQCLLSKTSIQKARKAKANGNINAIVGMGEINCKKVKFKKDLLQTGIRKETRK